MVYSSAFEVKSFHCVFTTRLYTVISLLALPPFYGKYEVSWFHCFQCDGAWWLPLTGLSWLPYVLLAPPSFRHLPQANLLLTSLGSEVSKKTSTKGEIVNKE